MLRKNNFAAKSDFFVLKVTAEKLEINEFVNDPTSWNDLKTKVDDSVISQVKVVPLDLKN